MAAGIAFSRRVFLSLIGFVSVFGARVPGGVALPEPAHPKESELVVLRGWVLRRDDLDRLGPQ